MADTEFKLDFVIVGAQKAGTSAVDNYLRQHPEIATGKIKELHFFDNEDLFKAGNVDYKDLHNQINYQPGYLVSGECTPIYMYWNPSMKRIREYNPLIKIIVILRNPLTRAYSHWNMNRNRYGEISFLDSVKKESERVKEALPLQHREYSYVDRGFYSVQLERIYSLFKKEQVLVLKYEEFNVDPQAVLSKIFDFIGVNKKIFSFKNESVNYFEYKNKMEEEAREYLHEIYADDIKKVEKMLNWNCDDWRV